MTQRTNVSLHIDAPIGVVFDAIANVETLPKTAAAIEKTEIISETQSGVGTRFRETRRMGNRSMVTELEVTEYELNRRVRMVADSHGTVWDTTFSLESTDAGTRVDVDMEARPHHLVACVMNRLTRGMVRRSAEQHFQEVKAWCEAQT